MSGEKSNEHLREVSNLLFGRLAIAVAFLLEDRGPATRSEFAAQLRACGQLRDGTASPEAEAAARAIFDGTADALEITARGAEPIN
jgi:hypothetical protein